MTLGSITGTKTFDENRTFTGTDITARFSEPKTGTWKTVTFHYSYETNNLRGMVEKALDAHLNGKPIPERFSNISVGK